MWLEGGAGLPAGLILQVLDESVDKKSNFKVAWNCNWVESLDLSKANRYEVDPCRTFAYRSFQPTVGL